MTDPKATNPKDAIGDTKMPLHLVPPTATAYAALAHLDGALKYGQWNWRKAGVRSSVYIAAAARHLECYFNGEDIDPDSGVPNLGHALACINIVIDAEACGKLTDDRPPRVGLRKWFEKLMPTIAALREKHKDRKPQHYTIADSEDHLVAWKWGNADRRKAFHSSRFPERRQTAIAQAAARFETVSRSQAVQTARVDFTPLRVEDNIGALPEFPRIRRARGGVISDYYVWDKPGRPTEDGWEHEIIGDRWIKEIK
jgi:hypothetical protein